MLTDYDKCGEGFKCKAERKTLRSLQKGLF